MRVHDRFYHRANSVFEHNVDFSSRTIFLCGDIEEENISNAYKALLTLDSMNANRNEDAPITLIISTNGGDENLMWGLADAIINCQNTVKTIGMGRVCSAGPLLLASGDKGHRFAYPNTRIMLHQSWGEAGGKMKEIENDLKEFQTLDAMWTATMAERTNKDVKHWRKITTNNFLDKYIGAEIAKNWGIIDHIIGGED